MIAKTYAVVTAQLGLLSEFSRNGATALPYSQLKVEHSVYKFNLYDCQADKDHLLQHSPAIVNSFCMVTACVHRRQSCPDSQHCKFDVAFHF